jgi:hypothetical protein
MANILINVILVGNELFTSADRIEVSDAIQRTRTIYATVGLSVSELWWGIPLANARGREFIDDDGEAEALTDEWTVRNHGLDVFFVIGYAGSTIGLSRVDGPCDKDAKGMDGSVVAIEGAPVTTGIVAAHEAAHYLGLSHVNDPTNLMNPVAFSTATNLTAAQGDNMRDHCFVT